MNDLTFGNQTKNCVPTRHHERANVLGEEPVRRALDAGFRSYCGDVGTLPPQNVFDGHRVLPSCGLAAYLIDWRGSAGLAPQSGMEAVLYEQHQPIISAGSSQQASGTANRSVDGARPVPVKRVV